MTADFISLQGEKAPKGTGLGIGSRGMFDIGPGTAVVSSVSQHVELADY